MITKLELIKEIRTRVLERIISDFGHITEDLTKTKLSIWDVRKILYDECNIQMKKIFDEEFLR
jgi:hypothetical protein